jgi:hypothetical protein
MPELRPVDLPQDHDIATPGEYKQAILQASRDRRMSRERTDKLLAVVRSWASLPNQTGTTEEIGTPNGISQGEVHIILANFGKLISEKLAVINGYRHGVHPNGEAFPWSTTGFAARRDEGSGPVTWTMRRNFLTGLRELNGWLPAETLAGD